MNIDFKKEIIINGELLRMEGPTRAEDFPFEENTKGFIESCKSLLDKDSHALLVDSLRGLSYKMQYIMCMRIMDYTIFGYLVPTGVNHVDAMIKELVSKFPFDHKVFEQFYGLSN